ncbi:MAG TPA: cell division protein SepF, partial [Fimbriimonadaceae bacterium]|nr:cell division protein SepF [Fimbriimonadaceae bacterium]
MDELELQEKPGIFGRLASMLSRREEDEYEDEEPQSRTYPARNGFKAHITVRRQITSFDDALEAATGFKAGEQQILNLTATDPVQRQKIVDFMCGVNFAQEGTWEEIGENIYLVAPGSM